MKTFWFVLISLIFVLSFAQGYGYQQKLKVVATNSIIGDWIKNVAGDEVDLTVLVGPNGDVHTFEPTPSDDIILSKADITFENGLGLEPWMAKLLNASGSHAQRIILTEGIIERPLTLREGNQEETDPHVWHNVRYAMRIVQRINHVLKRADPSHAQIYEFNTQKYLKLLQDLDSWVMRSTSQIPKGQRKLVTNHDSLGYYCERYQFTLVGTAFDSFTTEAEDPSARQMAHLVFQIKKTGVPAIFAENVQNSKVINSIAHEAHVELAPPLYTDALGEKGGPADTYIKMIQNNTQIIVSALQPKEKR